MNREECIEAGIDPRLAGNAFLHPVMPWMYAAMILIVIGGIIFGKPVEKQQVPTPAVAMTR